LFPFEPDPFKSTVAGGQAIKELNLIVKRAKAFSTTQRFGFKKRMSSRISNLIPFLIAFLAIGIVSLNAFGKIRGGEAMKQDLLLGMSPEDIEKIEIMYSFNSGKTGAGRQEIWIYGNGSVKLVFSKNMDTPSQELTGKVDKLVVHRLLELMQEYGWDNLPSSHAKEGLTGSKRMLILQTPHVKKTFEAIGAGSREFEAISAAVKLVASLALPETLLHKFFPNL
jgi:hypothetical protein